MSDIVTSRIFTDGEKGITATKLNDIVGSSVIQPAFYSAKSTASTADAADTLLILKAAGSYAQVPVSTFVTSVAGQLPNADPEIWSVRLRSYNATGNSSFIVDQVNAWGGKTNLANGSRIVDRWTWGKVGTHTMNSSNPVETILVPGTSYLLNNRSLTLTLGTQQTTLGAGDYGYIFQQMEGSQIRPLFSDVHSVSILIKSSIANLKFSYWLQDPTSAHTYTKLCSLGAANTWTLVTIPNIPVFMGAGTWAIDPGVLGAFEGICLGAGTTMTASSDGVWLSTAAIAAPGTTNFFGSSIGATVSVAFIQHEPGPVCSTLMDKPFIQNLNECQRYYSKSYLYAVKPGSVSSAGVCVLQTFASTNPLGTFRFPVRMAITPITVQGYSDVTGSAGGVRDLYLPGDRSITAPFNVGDLGFGGFSLTSNNTSATVYTFQWTADTGW